MITRFEQDMDGSMCPEDGGQWVRFDDLVAEIAELEAENEQLKKEIDKLYGE